MKTIAIAIDRDMLASIDRLSGARGESRNRSKVIRAAVAEYRACIGPAAENEWERSVFRRHRARLGREAAVLVKKQAKS